LRLDLLPIVYVPEKFDLLSEDILLDNIKKATDSGVGAIIISEMQSDYINKKFRDMPDVRDKLVVTNEMNPFVGVSNDDLNNMLLAGIISKKDAIKSIYINEFIDMAIAKDKRFIDKTYEQRVVIIDAMADAKMNVGKSNVSLLGDNGGLNSLDASGNEIATPVDVEAEAKAKLKGTVGGVQGIIGINQAVGKGEMTEASAELLLIEIYGFDPIVAGKLIDPPKMKTLAQVQTIAPNIPIK